MTAAKVITESPGEWQLLKWCCLGNAFDQTVLVCDLHFHGRRSFFGSYRANNHGADRERLKCSATVSGAVPGGCSHICGPNEGKG